jgi:hypothetical protein
MKRRLRWAALGLGVTGLGGTVCISAVDGQAPANPANPPAVQQPAQQPLDIAIAWMHEAKRNYSAVKDYTCTLISRESIRGELKEENVVQMKFRPQPFSVYMRWLAPSHVRGQEVAYIHGRNGNKMRVQSKGLLKIAGFVSIDVNDPRVSEHSRHNIYEAGMGHLIETTIAHWTAEQKIGGTECRIAEYDYNNRRCYRIENIRPQQRPGIYAYRSIIFLDKDSKLPIRNESYDWPRPGGPSTGALLETYSFVDLQFNVGLTDRDFNK